MIKGLIIKALAGFYYVETGDQVYECKPRGVFRKNNETPLVGDRVEITIDDNNKGVIESIINRKNALIRPPVANLDRIFIVVSTTKPQPNLVVIDKIIAYCEDMNIEPVIVINKCDLKDPKRLYDIYSKAGFITICVSARSKEGIAEIPKLIENKICALTGNSGVGKSSILNVINSEFKIKTADISDKLGRGRHTTRHVQLYKINSSGNYGYIADTPGFSKFDFSQMELIHKDNLKFCFREFKDYLTSCKFTSCSHTKEKGCSILQGVENGEISKSRHDSYLLMYEEASSKSDWEFKT